MITAQTEPRASLLWAIWLTGVVLSMLAAKGHTWMIVGEIGKMLTTGTSGWFVARWWYMRAEKKADKTLQSKEKRHVRQETQWPNFTWEQVHAFDPIHNGADECECGLTESAPAHRT